MNIWLWQVEFFFSFCGAKGYKKSFLMAIKIFIKIQRKQQQNIVATNARE